VKPKWSFRIPFQMASRGNRRAQMSTRTVVVSSRIR
jgi:hypothetical protein